MVLSLNYWMRDWCIARMGLIGICLRHSTVLYSVASRAGSTYLLDFGLGKFSCLRLPGALACAMVPSQLKCSVAGWPARVWPAVLASVTGPF